MHEIAGTSLPRAAQPFVAFGSVLRDNGIAVAPDQLIDWLRSLALLGPRDVEQLRISGRAVLGVHRDRWSDFDALFDAFFLGLSLPSEAPAGDDDETEAHEGAGDADAEIGEEDDAGREATVAERLGYRALTVTAAGALDTLMRLGPARLPRRRSYRWAPRRGRALDLRRTLREAARRDGEAAVLLTRSRKMRQRRIVLLIDVSGSMAERTEDAMLLAHALGQVAERWEAFTLGTRLTRLTPALRLAHPDAALDRAAGMVADIDGGTRIGDALSAYLSVPRYASFARGAAVVVLSDGLERGSPDLMMDAVRRLSRLAWRLVWLSPLATAADFAPRTEGLAAIAPDLDVLADGADNAAIVGHLLSLTRAA
ncbi:MAG: VWA domain-containing protein [Pseudomonadota bacterium]